MKNSLLKICQNRFMMLTNESKKTMWLERLVKLYFGISISGALLAFVFFVYVSFQGDGFAFGLSFILMCMFIFVAYIDIQAVRQVQQGKNNLAIILILFWVYLIKSTLMSTDNQWQSRLIWYVLDAVALFKVLVLAMSIKKRVKPKVKKI